eukprot:scaffold2857_cov344-Pavlova_lutheri.AAC.22
MKRETKFSAFSSPSANPTGIECVHTLTSMNVTAALFTSKLASLGISPSKTSSSNSASPFSMGTGARPSDLCVDSLIGTISDSLSFVPILTRFAR